MAAVVITYPFQIVSLPRPPGEITWVGAASGSPVPVSDVRGPASGRRVPSSASSTILGPRLASALAYVAGPISGALVLLTDSNDTVRFHAWQSIVALGALALALLASYGLAFGALFVSTSAIVAMIDIATAIWIVFAIVWLTCLWKATSGERWKLPLAGRVAERLTFPKTS